MTDQVAVLVLGILIAVGAATSTVFDYQRRAGGAISPGRWLVILVQVAMILGAALAAIVVGITDWREAGAALVGPAFIVSGIIVVTARPPATLSLDLRVGIVLAWMLYAVVVVVGLSAVAPA